MSITAKDLLEHIIKDLNTFKIDTVKNQSPLYRYFYKDYTRGQVDMIDIIIAYLKSAE